MSGVTLDADRRVTCQVELAGLSIDDVRLEAWCGRLGADGALMQPTLAVMEASPAGWTAVVQATGSGEYGVAVRAVPANPALASPYECGLVRNAVD